MRLLKASAMRFVSHATGIAPEGAPTKSVSKGIAPEGLS
jgi:hypothetical protein